MGEVAGSVGIIEAGAAASGGGGDASDKSISFVDGEPGADTAGAILDEVLSGEAPAEGEGVEGGAAGSPPADAPPKPAAKTPDATPPESLEGARLRKGFAKLGEERQKVLELQNTVRAERQAVQQYVTKAQAHDQLVARLKEDPAGVIAELGDEVVNKTLQGFIDREKSPAEREVAKLREETKRDKEAAAQRDQERVAAEWRAGIGAKVQADDRFDLVNTLGLHGDVIDVMTSYYEKHSERDDAGNVVVPAILPWDTAAQAVEDHRAGMIEKSKRYGKRAPAAEQKKDTPTVKTPAAPVKRATTSLSSVPVAEAPHREEDLSDDPDERERQLIASLGF